MTALLRSFVDIAFVKGLGFTKIEKLLGDFAIWPQGFNVMEEFFLDRRVIKAWKELADRPDWVRLNSDLLKKVSNNPHLASKVDDYYKNAIPKNTPSGFNGEGVYNGVKFNKFGHPELKPHVSDPNHIVQINMKGNYTTDMTDAKNALQSKLPLGEVIVKSNPNGGWSPFYIEKNGVKTGPYTWHHHQDGTNMYPVKKEIHDKIVGKHTGGREIVTRYPELIGFFNQE